MSNLRERSENCWLLDYAPHERLHVWLEAHSSPRKGPGVSERARVLWGLLRQLGSRLATRSVRLRTHAQDKEVLALKSVPPR